MLFNTQQFTPQKIMKIHRMLQEYELYASIKEYRPYTCEEIIYFVSRCMEIQRRQNFISKQLLKPKIQ